MAGGRIEILDPATEEVVATAAQAERADVEAAIEAAAVATRGPPSASRIEEDA